MVRAAFYAFLLLTVTDVANAATILVSPLPSSESALVTVEGVLEFGDSEQFRQKVSTLPKAVVVFQSDGGSVVAGIQIGRLIRLRNFATLVPNNARCASACALAWLGGTRRFMGENAQIGFHAAYNAGSGQETGVGNALVGAYLSQIGLPDRAVIYVTQAPPNSMTWVTMSEAQQMGIEVTLFTLPNQQSEPKKSNPPAIVGDTETLHRKATEFILSLFKQWNSRDASSVLHFVEYSYDQNVNYYGKLKSKQDVLSDKRKFIERWPQRTYQVRDGSMIVQCDFSSSTCNVSGILDWHVSSLSRKAKSSGSARFNYDLNLASSIVITQENGIVLERQ